MTHSLLFALRKMFFGQHLSALETEKMQ